MFPLFIALCPFPRFFILNTSPPKDYFSKIFADDLTAFLNDIRENRQADSTTSEDNSVANDAQKLLDEVINFKGSAQEKQLLIACRQLQIPYEKLTLEEKMAFMSALSKSKLLIMVGGMHGREKRRK